MKSFLNKELFPFILCVLLLITVVKAEPIQLIPKTIQTPSGVVSKEALPEAVGFWEGTPPSIIEKYFGKLPLRIMSPTLRDLRKRLLNEKYLPLLNTPSYEEILIKLLSETGQIDEANNLLANSNIQNKENNLLDLRWLAGESKKACEKITNLIRTSSTPEWKKQNIYCLYLNGESERGKVALELLSENKQDDFSLLSSLFDPNAKPPFDENISSSPFLLNVWMESGQILSFEVLKGLTPASLLLIEKSTKIPKETCYLAAIQALQEGIPTGALVDILKDAPKDDLLVLISLTLKNPKPETLEPLLKQASGENKLDLVVQTFNNEFRQLTPSPETLKLAPYLVRGYLQIGDKDTAKKWASYLLREAPDEAIGILPLIHIAFPETKWEETQIQAWQNYQQRMNPSKAAQHTDTLRQVLRTIGENSGIALRSEKNSDGKNLDLLDAAVQGNRKGEVLLFTLINFGNSPLSELEPSKFSHLNTALYKAGYKDEARDLAIEYLIAKGI